MKTLKAGKTLFKLSAMSLAVGLGLGAIAQASAAVVVDGRKSPDTKVTIADTGATVVNISGASSGGVSHNTFTQFDVDPTGVILNNSSTGSSTTLGGDIAGNSNMAGGSATVILNEVNSRDPSQLNGMVEVAGQQAAVVIANPSGISCDGCGFINASRSTLVTGTAEMSNGELTGFNVNDGQVVITGKGMDDRSTGYTDIISRSVKVNAQLQAQDLRIVTGSNHVDYATLATRGISSSVFSKPSLAVDVSSLGGMYANKIQLIGTEDGVGVRNNGTISASDTLSLSTKGKLENNGLIAGGEVAIDTHKNTLDNDHGTLQAERALTINSGNIDNNVDGAIVSNGTLTIDTHGQSLDNAGQGISGNGAVSITADEIDNSSWIASNSTLTLNTDSLNNSGSIYGQDISATAKKVSNGGSVQANNSLQVDADDIDNHGKIAAADASIYAGHAFDNEGGEVATTHSLLVNTKTLTNTGGKLSSDGSLQLVVNKLDNTANCHDKNSGGVINGAEVTIKADNLDNDRGAISGNSINITGNDIDIANGSLMATGDININATDDFYTDNNGVVQSSAGNITINAADELSNDGIITTTKNISLTGKDISNNGDITTIGNLNMYASATIENNKGGYIYGANGFSVEAVKRIDNAGEFYTENNGVMKSDAINIKQTGVVYANNTTFYVNKMSNKGSIYGAYTKHPY